MKLLSTQYLHEKTGITFEIEFNGDNKRIKLKTKYGDNNFMFTNSQPKTLIKIGEAILEIGEFCEGYCSPVADAPNSLEME